MALVMAHLVGGLMVPMWWVRGIYVGRSEPPKSRKSSGLPRWTEVRRPLNLLSFCLLSCWAEFTPIMEPSSFLFIPFFTVEYTLFLVRWFPVPLLLHFNLVFRWFVSSCMYGVLSVIFLFFFSFYIILFFIIYFIFLSLDLFYQSF